MTFPLIAIDPGVKGAIAWNPTTPVDENFALKPHKQGRSPLCPKYAGPAAARVAALPASSIARIELIRSIVATEYVPFVLMEDVGYHRAGNSARSSAKLANVVGQIEAAVRCAGSEVYWVSPKQWPKVHPFKLLPTPPKLPVKCTPDFRKKTLDGFSRIRKGMIKRMVENVFPGTGGVNLATADALAILHFGLTDDTVQQVALAKMREKYGFQG